MFYYRLIVPFPLPGHENETAREKLCAVTLACKKAKTEKLCKGTGRHDFEGAISIPSLGNR